MSLTKALDVKLGRCAKCMREAAGLSAASLMLLVVMAAFEVSTAAIVAALIPAIACTFLLLAHLTAFVVRGPTSAADCKSCAERARVRAREKRWQQLWTAVPKLFRTKPTRARKRGGGCRGCAKKGARPAEEIADELPRATAGLLEIVRGSVDYQTLLPRLIGAEPMDSWQSEGRHHFLYQLRPAAEGADDSVLFVTDWEHSEPISVLVISRAADRDEASVIDLRAPGASQTVPLAG